MSDKSHEFYKMYLVFLTYGLFASVFTVGKLALTLAPPFFLTGLRYTIAGVFLIGLEALRSKGKIFKQNLRPHLGLIIGIAIFSVFLTNGLEFWGLQYLKSGDTCLFYSMCPFFSAIIAYFMLGEKMTSKKYIGLGIGLVGFVMLIMSTQPEANYESAQSNGWSFSLPEMMVSTSALTAVIGWSYFKKLTFHRGFAINLANGYSFLIAGLLGLMVSFVCEKWPQLDSKKVWLTLSWQVAYITIIHSIICYTLYAHALQKYSVTFMSFAGISNPVFTAFYGFMFLNESISFGFVGCVLLVGLGLYCFYIDEKTKHIN